MNKLLVLLIAALLLTGFYGATHLDAGTSQSFTCDTFLMFKYPYAGDLTHGTVICASVSIAPPPRAAATQPDSPLAEPASQPTSSLYLPSLGANHD